MFDLPTLYTGDVQKSSKKKDYVRFYDIDRLYLTPFNERLTYQYMRLLYRLFLVFLDSTSLIHSRQLVDQNDPA